MSIKCTSYFEQLHPYSACGPVTVFLPSKIYYFQALTLSTLEQKVRSQNLLITNHLYQSIDLANQEQVLDCALAFASLSMLRKNAKPKSFN